MFLKLANFHVFAVVERFRGRERRRLGPPVLSLDALEADADAAGGAGSAAEVGPAPVVWSRLEASLQMLAADGEVQDTSCDLLVLKAPPSNKINKDSGVSQCAFGPL